MLKIWLLLTLMLISAGTMAKDAPVQCPYSIKDATVMLSLDKKTNLKITSSAMCNQKMYFADRFFDAEVELWKSGKLIGKFYSRRVSYDQSNLKLILQNSTLLHSDNLDTKKLDNARMIIMDLKKSRLTATTGSVKF